MKRCIVSLLIGGLIMMSVSSQTAQSTQTAQSKTIVAYFSCTGNTKKLAAATASALNADLHEIIPLQAYSNADLNWNDSKSRSTIECNDTTSRPKIKNSIDISSYDTVILAYPIWWGLAPKILYTFVESNDFQGKNLIALCTSGGSGLGRSGTELANLAKKTNGKNAKQVEYKGGKAFSTRATEDEIKKYILSIM